MATIPSFSGNSDFYGLGIRIGFYLQWFSSVLAPWLAPSELEGIRFTNGLFIAATFVALVVSTAEDVSNLQVVEVYIILLLTFGYFSYLIPIFAWRILTRFNPYIDPWRWPLAPQGRLFDILYYILLVAVASYQLWFWIARVPALVGQTYQEYGFLFARISLNSLAFRVVNIIFYCILLLLCAALLSSRMVGMKLAGKSKAPPRRKQRIRLLRNVAVVLNFTVASVNVVAVELTIHWNHIDGVNSLRSAGQLIPFAIGVGSALRIVYVFFVKPQDGKSERPYLQPVAGAAIPLAMPKPQPAIPLAMPVHGIMGDRGPTDWDQLPGLMGRQSHQQRNEDVRPVVVLPQDNARRRPRAGATAHGRPRESRYSRVGPFNF